VTVEANTVHVVTIALSHGAPGDSPCMESIRRMLPIHHPDWVMTAATLRSPSLGDETFPLWCEVGNTDGNGNQSWSGSFERH
jgi:hypothetical protein